MTSQLTPERTTSLPVKTDETRERPPVLKTDEARERPVILQPWFLMAVLSMVAIVLVVLFS